MPDIEFLSVRLKERVFPAPRANPHPDGAYTRKMVDVDTGEDVFAGGYSHALGASVSPSYLDGNMRVTGYREQTRNGEKFHVISFYPESTKEAAREYLKHRLAGTQSETVSVLVDAFGENAPRECLVNHQMLAGLLPGQPHIAESFRLEHECIQLQCVMVEYGFKPHESKRIFDGIRAAYPNDDPISVIEENPYRVLELNGEDEESDNLKIKDLFKKIDRFALKACDIPENDERRQTAAVHYVIDDAMRRGVQGHPAGSTIFGTNAIIQRAADEKIEERFIREIEHDAVKARAYGIEMVDGRIGLADYLRAERIVAGKMRGLLDAKSHKSMHVEMDKELAKPMPFQLDDSQLEALNTLARNKVAILTGGPGTGKSTLIDKFASAADAAGMKMILAAPTGKAAKRITETTNREAKTIHRHLGEKGGELLKEADIVILDESSMIDSKLMAQLVAAMKPESRLVLVGDVNQLPPVGAGQPFKDLIESGAIPVAKLQQPHRQGKGSPIIDAAYDMVKGWDPTQRADGKELCIATVSDDDMQQQTIQAVQRALDEGYRPEDIQVLTPKRINHEDRPDPVSADSLNPVLRDILNTHPRKHESVEVGGRLYCVGDRVMQTVNDYDLEMVNGDMGEVTDVCYNDRGTCIQVRLEGETDDRTIPRDKICNLSTAFAMSIHKSQGSQFPVTIMPISYGSSTMLSRNLVYTGATRAKIKLEVLESSGVLNTALANVDVVERTTWLADGIKEQEVSNKVKNLFERAERDYGDDEESAPAALSEIAAEPAEPAPAPAQVTDQVAMKDTLTKKDREKAAEMNRENPGSGDIHQYGRVIGLADAAIDEHVRGWDRSARGVDPDDYNPYIDPIDDFNPSRVTRARDIEVRMNARHVLLTQHLRDALIRAQSPDQLSQADFSAIRAAVKQAEPERDLVDEITKPYRGDDEPFDEWSAENRDRIPVDEPAPLSPELEESLGRVLKGDHSKIEQESGRTR